MVKKLGRHSVGMALIVGWHSGGRHSFFYFFYTIHPYEKKIRFEKGGPLLISTFIQTNLKLVRLEPNFDTVYLLKDYIWLSKQYL